MLEIRTQNLKMFVQLDVDRYIPFVRDTVGSLHVLSMFLPLKSFPNLSLLLSLSNF